jgi:hypothetical protein
MKTYIVCSTDEVGGEKIREMVGVVRAGSPLELFELADEVGNPNDFEYLCVRPGTTGGILSGQAVGSYLEADEESRWRTFTDIVGGDFDSWYAGVYVPSLPKPKCVMPE